jgi:hypothetical protein
MPLIKAGKDFDLLLIPGAEHYTRGIEQRYVERQREIFPFGNDKLDCYGQIVFWHFCAMLTRRTGMQIEICYKFNVW